MPKNLTNSKKGFTIIEVVLVLAIAGLIFLMVFTALPALQRSQRDTQRKNDLGRFASQLQQYQSNNRGKVPNNSVKKDANPTGVYITTSDNAGEIANTEYNTNNDGWDDTIDTGDWVTFLNTYMWAANDDFTDPGGTPYGIADHGYPNASGDSDMVSPFAGVSGTPKVDYIIHVYHGAICGTDEGTVAESSSGSSRKLAFVYKLEGAGYYCGEI